MKTNFSFDMQALDEGIHSRFPNGGEALGLYRTYRKLQRR